MSIHGTVEQEANHLWNKYIKSRTFTKTRIMLAIKEALRKEKIW